MNAFPHPVDNFDDLDWDDIDDEVPLSKNQVFDNLDSAIRKEIDDLVNALEKDAEIKRIAASNEEQRINIVIDKKDEKGKIYPKQEDIAKKLLSKIASRDLSNYKYFDFFINVPRFKSLGKNTLI